MALQTEQLERETEEVRSDLSRTLDELQRRMSPGNVVDQAIDYARHGDGAEMVGNLRRQVVQNPLALGLIGAGVAWLMMPSRARNGRRGNGRVSSEHFGGTSEHFGQSERFEQSQQFGQIEETGDGAGARIKDASGRIIGAGSAAGDRLKGSARAGAESLSDAGRYASERLSATGEQLSGSASSAAHAVSQGYGRLAHGAGATATQARQSISSFGRGIADTTGSASRNFMQTCKEQPLILAGLGLAIGAAIGAALPRSEAEDRLMGETSDDLKEGAEAFASEKMENAQAFAGEKMEQAKEAVQDTAEEMEKAATDSSHARGDSGRTPSIIPSSGESALTESEADREPLPGFR